MTAIYRVQNKPTLIQISNDLITSMSKDSPIYKILPIKNRNSLKLRWKIKDNFKGLMTLRGAGGEPTRVNPVGDKTYEERPGVFGNFSTIDEIELMELARGIPKELDVTVDVQSEIRERQAQLMELQMNRIRQMSWASVLSGTVALPLPGGGIGFSVSYSLNTFAPTVPWSTAATSTPLKDWQGLQVAYGRGTSNKFDENATAYMNSKTMQYMLNNSNAADWGGKRSTGGGTVQGLGYYNQVRMDMKLPSIVTWDEGYKDDSDAFQLDIPDGKIVVVAGRPNGELPGEVQMTYNAVSEAPGGYAEVHDFTKEPRKTIPPRIDVHAGFNGGPVIERPTQILVMTVN